MGSEDAVAHRDAMRDLYRRLMSVFDETLRMTRVVERTMRFGELEAEQRRAALESVSNLRAILGDPGAGRTSERIE